MRAPFEAIQTVLNFTGKILVVLGFILLTPLACVLIFHETDSGLTTILSFVIPAAASLSTGLVLSMAFAPRSMSNVRAMLICGAGWIACSAFGALPYVIGLGTGYLDAFFEAVSGFTTTGITMLSGLDDMPRSIIFWRSLTQWVGGLGILAFVLAIGVKGIGAHRLFGAESHKIEMARPVPGMHNTIRILWMIYGGFTAAIIAALALAGMPVFDSICHSFTALSTGGFSPYDASIGHYEIAGYPHYRAIEYIVILGMILGGMNFLVHFKVVTGNVGALWKGTEVKYWWGIIFSFTVLIMLERYFRVLPGGQAQMGGEGFWAGLESSFRGTLFQVSSIISTTGFGTRDIGSPWFGSASRQLFLLLMFIGGCVGSTGGGFKVFRVAILTRIIRRELFRLRAPLGSVSTVVVDGEKIGMDEIQRVSGLFFAWAALIAVGGLITALLSDKGSYASLSGMFSAAGNIGPCYIPTGELPGLNPLIKITWIFGMLAGRLEILPLLLFLNPRSWRY